MEYLESPFEVSIKRLDWQKRGLQQTASGYGRKLTTEYMLRVLGETRAYRVYAVCFSNVASFYIVRSGKEVWIRDSQLEDERDRAIQNGRVA